MVAQRCCGKMLAAAGEGAVPRLGDVSNSVVSISAWHLLCNVHGMRPCCEPGRSGDLIRHVLGRRQGGVGRAALRAVQAGG